MKGKDYKANVDIYDKELERLNEELTNLDPKSPEYLQVVEAIKKLNEAKLTEEKCYVEYKEHLVPDWIPKLLSVTVTGGLGVMIYRGELAGKVVGSAAVAMLNKLRF